MADLRHLHRAWDVDRLIVLEEKKVVAIRFSAHERCLDESDRALYQFYEDTLLMDGALAEIAPRVCNYCVIYAVDTNEVSDFNELYELDAADEPFALMFFFKGKRIQVDIGTGNNHKINFVLDDPEELIRIMDAVYVGAKEKNLGLVSAPKKYRQAAITR